MSSTTTLSPAMERGLTLYRETGTWTGVKKSTRAALERRGLVGETLDNSRQVSLSTIWRDDIFQMTPTRDLGVADVVFWDRARRGQAKGLELSGLFLKPLQSKIAAWVMGLSPKFRIDSGAGVAQQKISEWWQKAQSDVIRAYEEAVGLGDCYLVVNPNLKLTIVPPNVVKPIVSESDYSQIIGWRISEVHPHPMRPGDNMTIVDEYTAEKRTRKIYKSGKEVLSKTYPNLIGRIPVVHIPFNRGSNETFGHPAGEPLLPLLHKYGEIFEFAITGNKKQGRPTPVIEQMGTTQQIKAFWEMFGRKVRRQRTDGTEYTEYVLDMNTNSVLTLGGNATFKYAQPGSFSKDTEALLGLMFYLLLQHTEIPEAFWGNAIASSKASAESQIPAFTRFIEKTQSECNSWLIELVQIAASMMAMWENFGTAVNWEEAVLLQWPKLTTADGRLTLDAINLGLSRELLDDETALWLMPLDVENPKETLTRARTDGERRRAQFQPANDIEFGGIETNEPEAQPTEDEIAVPDQQISVLEREWVVGEANASLA